MERIGIAASKIAKGNIFLYNFFVFLLTILFSLLVFFIFGAALLVVFIVFDYINKMRTIPDFQQNWFPLLVFCMKISTGVIGLFALFAIFKNIKFKK